MQYTQFGSTGVFVSRVALGTMTFGGAGKAPWSVVGGLDYKASEKLVGLALDSGINLIDTADVYGFGECEEFVGRALGARRDDVILATKLAGRVGTGPNDVGLTRLHIMRSLEKSLRRLGTDYIDVYQLHAYDPLTPMEETLAALDDAVRQGKIRYVGASNFAAWQTMKLLATSSAGGFPRVTSLELSYSVAQRDIETEIVPMALDQNLGIMVYGPLAGALLSGKFDRHGTTDESSRRAVSGMPPVDEERGYDIIDQLRVVAARHGSTVPVVALAWVLAQPGVTSVIMGARRPEHFTENIRALELTLTEEDLRELDEVSKPAVAPYPSWLQPLYLSGQRLPQG